jgi:hypothetical protein
LWKGERKNKFSQQFPLWKTRKTRFFCPFEREISCNSTDIFSCFDGKNGIFRFVRFLAIARNDKSGVVFCKKAYFLLKKAKAEIAKIF